LFSYVRNSVCAWDRIFCDNEMTVDSNDDDIIVIKVMITLTVFVTAKVAIHSTKEIIKTVSLI
jgi:hypothetical protein